MDEKEISTMNIVPLIDIMLVLLAIVLVTSTFVVTGKIPVDLPSAKTVLKNSNESQEVIEVDSTENIYFRNKRLTLNELKNELSSLSGVSSQTQVIFRADKKVSLEIFVKIMDMLKECGFNNLNLQAGRNVR